MKITVDCKLPCGGNPDKGIPSELIVRCASVSEWKSIISASSKKYRYIALWKLCSDTPGWSNEVEIDKWLHPIDIAEISKYARIATISPSVVVNHECPYCGYSDSTEVQISDSKFEKVSESVETVTIDYNGEKKEVVVSFLTERKIHDMKEKANEILEQRQKEDNRYDVSIQDVISEIKPYFAVVSVNRQASNYDYFRVMLPDLNYKEYQKIDKALDKVQGYVTQIPMPIKCKNPKCGKDFNLYLPLQRVLFHQ